MSREERKQKIREGYEKYPNHTLESVVRYNTQAIMGMPPARKEQFGHELVLEVAKELLAERKA